ncbi:MAG: bifunctional phosphopantothenoylcysteine decarboxylase/phosphopantothenate--cysteine ligase CoaBC [Ardenticatenia bacterium]|nr:MAG: bifunctional phosphopantothenoylcysteine decarboxylase/phosphopantothenate--cysteine ligase CoaBC [Ardenticatenia bacterium]
MGDRLLEGRHILLGVTGGVAAYKAVALASRLTQAGAVVDVVLSAAAMRFVTPLSFESVTRRRAHYDMFALPADTSPQVCPGDLLIAHIALARSADLMIIAPATANTLAKLAHGIADNLLTAVALAVTVPLVIAPAMESHMWEHPATQSNLAALRARGVVQVGPATGHLASGASGVGRMSEPEEIIAAARMVLACNGDLAGRRVVVSAGGTREAIDPVRFIGNRSSGKMGYALANAARDRGAQVVLVTAPTALPDPYGVQLVRAESASEMRDAVLAALEGADALVMAAAVADYRPVQVSAQKIKKTEENLMLELTRTPDILGEVAGLRAAGRGPRVVVGFAAETADLLANAQAKLRQKRLDLIVANDVSAPDAGFGVDTNRVTLLWADGSVEPLPLMTKEELAHVIWDRVQCLWA